LRLAAFFLHREIVDVAFVLQDLGDRTFSLDEGMTTDAFCTPWALRMRVSISAIGSLMLILFLL
jgi:hypothetical protein